MQVVAVAALQGTGLKPHHLSCLWLAHSRVIPSLGALKNSIVFLRKRLEVFIFSLSANVSSLL
jgi:hypothetical protein